MEEDEDDEETVVKSDNNNRINDSPKLWLLNLNSLVDQHMHIVIPQYLDIHLTVLQFVAGITDARWDYFKGNLEQERLRICWLFPSREANDKADTVSWVSLEEIKQQMGKDIDEVGKIARNIKIKLEEMDKDVNLASREMPKCGKGSSVDRFRMTKTNALKKKFKERLADFQVLRQNIQDEYREIVERRIFTVTGTKPDDEMVDRLIETGNGEEIFQKAIQETGRGQVLDTLKEIQERHDAVKEIEKKLLDLHQIFLDMAVLVEAQGDLLDNIEVQVTNAVDHVHSGNDALRTAKSLQRKSRKCMMIAITILLIIAIITVLSILKPWKK
ncbi:hypothetical protein Sjap_003307 [Stephania japonica]|uniref:t-SNARE coiled-coil homology domain-containing protein n=1 Tax=Stephania japonica TaxID=461633 RepID=A0AAP0PTG3_9MAGN